MTPGVGPRAATKLLEKFGSAENVFHARRSELESLRLKPETIESIIKQEFHEKADEELQNVRDLGGDVLVLDDFLIAPMKDAERRDLLEVLEDRYEHTSTVITSQLPTKNWHEALGDPTVADAICDRLLHNAHRIVLKGPSRRKEGKLDS